MDTSLFLRHGRGLILPNDDEISEQNISEDGEDEVGKTFDFVEKVEKETKPDENESSTPGLDKVRNSEDKCLKGAGGVKARLKSKETGQDICEGKKGSWYAFLDGLYIKFSEYLIQKDRQKYNVANLDDWGQAGKPQGISVTPKTFGKFLDKIINYNVTEFETIKKQNTTTDLQIRELNQVLSFTLSHKPTIHCLEPVVTVIDTFIGLNETMQNLVSNSDADDSCKNYKDRLNAGKYNLFKFLALDKVFIDADLSFSGKKISVAIIAPNWEVVGSRSIDLSGSDGTPPVEPKAKDGAHPGNSGVNGAPGNPGATGETFFGIGATFIGGDNLKVISNGGQGGLGQDGGDGAVGLTGDDAPIPSKNEPGCVNDRFKGFRCIHGKEKRENKNRYTTKITRKFEIFGVLGKPGASGGDGGKGGKGGKPGNITILELGQPSKVMRVASEGKEGSMGKGGKGGPGGKSGQSTTGTFITEISKLCFHNCVVTYWEDEKRSENPTIGPVGKKGSDGGNDKDIKDPEPARGINRLPEIINEYNFNLRENLINTFQKCILLPFLHLLQSSSEVRKFYDILGLMDEFYGLEEQFSKLGETIEFSTFYSSLLERIREFAESRKDIQNSKDRKKVLNYLYTATLGKINNLKEISEKNLIVDMRKYLNMIVENIKTLEDVKRIKNKVDVITKYKNDFKKSFDQKIEEAKSLIEDQISPEIETINADIDEQINSLIEETIALEKESEKEKEELEKKRKELKKAMATKGIFNCFKIIGGAASLLGPVGEVAGAVMDVTSTVGQSLALSDQDQILELPSSLESSLSTLKDQIEEMRDKKVEYLNKIVNNISEEIKKNPEKLKDLTEKIDDIEKSLEKVSDKELDFKCVGIIEKELEKSIKAKGIELKKETGTEKGGEALKFIESMTNVMQFGSLFSDIHDEMKEDKEKMDTLTSSITEMSEKIELLKEYEKNIYVTIAPMLQEMEDHMKDIKAKLGSKSHVALDVTKWQVQNTLKDMKLQMQQLTEDHAVKDDLSRSIEKLSEVMTTLINVYDRIQSYQDQQNLANYIADISSVAATSIDIKDQQLANATNHLEFAIRGNIVLEQYKSAIGALKQWVFPFADRYIEASMLPSQLELEADIENLVHSAMDKIEAIKSKLDLYDSSIRNGDEYLECEEFSGQYVSSKPFFVWKNEDYRESISGLLSGKEVVLKSDVKESPLQRDAIKFSEIDFVFKAKNGTVQSSLSDTLKGFDIWATHLGNSYYRYANNITLINSDSVTISYSFEKNKDGDRIRSNDVYGRLVKGDLLLSPYTLWKVSLINKTDTYSFKDLEKFKNDTYIELSGLGSYVVDKNHPHSMESNAILPFFKPKEAGLNGCKRYSDRSTRSVNANSADDDFITSDASKGMSSPINFVCNFLKANLVSNLLLSINKTFFRQQKSVTKHPSQLHGDPETGKMDQVGELNPTFTDKDSISVVTDCTEQRMEQISDINFDAKFNGNNGCLNSFLLSDQTDKHSNHFIQVPDFNCSLLLADLVTRTVTRNTYKPMVDACLLSPREVVLGKISDSVVRCENDVKEILQRQLSEKELAIPSSWFRRLNDSAKSILYHLGLMGNADTEEYIQDIQALFD